MTLLPSVGSSASDFPLRNRRTSSSTWSWLFMAVAALILTGRDGVAALEVPSPTAQNLRSPLATLKNRAASCLGYTCDDAHWVQLPTGCPLEWLVEVGPAMGSTAHGSRRRRHSGAPGSLGARRLAPARRIRTRSTGSGSSTLVLIVHLGQLSPLAAPAGGLSPEDEAKDHAGASGATDEGEADGPITYMALMKKDEQGRWMVEILSDVEEPTLIEIPGDQQTKESTEK